MANEELVLEQNSSVEETQELDQFLESQEKPADEDFLAAFYEMHLKAFKGLIAPLGKNALKRIMINVMMGEFSPTEYKPVNDWERKAAFHFQEGVDKRMLLRFEHEVLKAQEALAKEEADLRKIEELNQNALSSGAKELVKELQEKGEIKVKE